jgi:hypothetical protein
VTTVTAVRTAARDIFFASEADATVPTFASLDPDIGFIDELHGANSG